ncbi:hypothetical protein HHK36_013657 [Tetracentron sinense]|uniref:Uncharacterized protein n=1 Tax=Tetracentron sinense TaxID=13715 RepID=A0A834Z2G8_TETSI|nr:hypothetical protein HHK36_013657 [Tetracentron sinense]
MLSKVKTLEIYVLEMLQVLRPSENVKVCDCSVSPFPMLESLLLSWLSLFVTDGIDLLPFAPPPAPDPAPLRCPCSSCALRYIPRYTFSWLVKPMWLIISMAADLTLVPSAAIGRDLEAA